MMRVDHIHGDAMQPGPERAVSPKSVEASPHAHEDLLGNILGVGAAVRQRALDQGAVACLLKPFSESGLVAAVNAALRPK